MNSRKIIPRWILIVVSGMLILGIPLGCQGPAVKILEPLPTLGSDLTTERQGWMEVFFSQPDHPRADTFRGGPDWRLVEAIDQAQFRVDIAAYLINLWSVRDALLRAHRRGVTVRVVTETDHIKGEGIQTLIGAGIPVVGDGGPGLMHQKFVIIDGEGVWTGSMNLTIQGVYQNDNNLIHIQSGPLSENYTVEFEEMFSRQFFGDNVIENTPNPSLNINGIQVETYFSPDDRPRERLLELIREAEDEIHFLAFSFTSDAIAQAMVERVRSGVVLKGVFDRSQFHSNVGSEWERLTQAGADVRLDGNPDKMHHKIMIIDQRIVVTGSYNFTDSAERSNDENILIIHDPSTARLYEQEFRRVYRNAHP